MNEDGVDAPIDADESGNWAMAWARNAINDPAFPAELKVRLCVVAMRVQASERRAVGKKQMALRAAEAAACGNGKYATPSPPLRIVDLGEL
jgi:hypothetical protein